MRARASIPLLCELALLGTQGRLSRWERQKWAASKPKNVASSGGVPAEDMAVRVIADLRSDYVTDGAGYQVLIPS